LRINYLLGIGESEPYKLRTSIPFKAITGAGTGAAGSAIGYTVINKNSFNTSSFVETTVIGGAVGGSTANPLAIGTGGLFGYAAGFLASSVILSNTFDQLNQEIFYPGLKLDY